MKRIGIAVVGAAVVLIAAVFIWFNVIRDDAPEAFSLTDPSETAETDAEDDASASASEPTEDSSADEAEAEAPTEDSGDAAPIESLDGPWTVADGSEAGYRVVEDLGSIQDFEAVGRTDQVSGSIEIAGTMITAADFTVDVASISSDDGRRDNQFAGPIMNSSEFPTATLVVTSPIDLGSVPEAGSPISTEASGELTLRGVTNGVTFPVDAQLLGDQIEIVASIDVLFEDYGIDNPSNPFVSVRDEGKVEVRLLLSQG